MAQILLVDVDSKIPNLALMKVSRYFKSQGKTVTLSRPHTPAAPTRETEQAWISCVFTWNRPHAYEIMSFLESMQIKCAIGGSGVDLRIKLPAEIESLTPDYDLYGDNRAVGFIQRGCIRKCQFCIVPIKEGTLVENEIRPLETWVPKGFRKILLLDNEFASFASNDPRESLEAQRKVMSTVKEHNWKISITQGYDLRCVSEDHAAMLADVKPWDLKFVNRRLYCAWDYIAIEGYVRRGIERLLAAGFYNKEIMVYCLVGFNTSHLQDYYRFHVLWREYGVLPYVMKYNMRTDDKFLNAFARYVDRGPAAYRNHTFEQYVEKHAPSLVQEARHVISQAEAGKISHAFTNKQPDMIDFFKMQGTITMHATDGTIGNDLTRNA